MRQRGITQTEAGRLLGLSRPDVSRLPRGDFREYSLERLFLWENRVHQRAGESWAKVDGFISNRIYS